MSKKVKCRVRVNGEDKGTVTGKAANDSKKVAKNSAMMKASSKARDFDDEVEVVDCKEV